MELFFSRDIQAGVVRLDPEESAHCVKVLRHREGDSINIIDGRGGLYQCRLSIAKALAEYSVKDGQIPDIAILIGPEGDFSEEEVNLAIELGWTPVHIGSSRLRTETAAVASVAAVYLRFLK